MYITLIILDFVEDIKMRYCKLPFKMFNIFSTHIVIIVNI